MWLAGCGERACVRRVVASWIFGRLGPWVWGTVAGLGGGIGRWRRRGAGAWLSATFAAWAGVWARTRAAGVQTAGVRAGVWAAVRAEGRAGIPAGRGPK